MKPNASIVDLIKKMSTLFHFRQSNKEQHDVIKNERERKKMRIVTIPKQQKDL